MDKMGFFPIRLIHSDAGVFLGLNSYENRWKESLANTVAAALLSLCIFNDATGMGGIVKR